MSILVGELKYGSAISMPSGIFIFDTFVDVYGRQLVNLGITTKSKYTL